MSTTTDRTQSINSLRSRRSRALTNRLLEFSRSVHTVALDPREQAVVSIRQYILAAEVCVPRGHLQLAQKLLTRAYALSSRFLLSAECVAVSSMRAHLEAVLDNTAARRFWNLRVRTWQDRCMIDRHQAEADRTEYYDHVLCYKNDDSKLPFREQFVCREVRHIIMPYRQCSERRYKNALERLQSPPISDTGSIFLSNESSWLRFRILCSMHCMDEAQQVLDELSRQSALSVRLTEYVQIGNAYLELYTMLTSEADQPHCFSARRTTLMNSFSHVNKELGGMMVALCVLEICRLVLEGEHQMADRRLAALRVRLVRRTVRNEIEDLRVFLRVINHILATQHRYRKKQPRKLLQQLEERTSPVRYTLQGIIPYDLLSILLLRYMGYTS